MKRVLSMSCVLETYVFIRLGESESLQQKELPRCCLPCSALLGCYCRSVKTVARKGEGSVPCSKPF